MVHPGHVSGPDARTSGCGQVGLKTGHIHPCTLSHSHTHTHTHTHTHMWQQGPDDFALSADRERELLLLLSDAFAAFVRKWENA
jgi:hypothetical protein